jgi:hypothetical protein
MVRRCARWTAIALVAATLSVPAAAAEPPAPKTSFGILYFVWHCLASPGGRKPHVIANAISGNEPWGPVKAFHYWAEPALGTYCPSDRPDVLRKHAEMLRDAGIEFVVVDASNFLYTDKERAPQAAAALMRPFDQLLKVWSEIPGAPRIVPWAPLTSDSTSLDWMLDRLQTKPEMLFKYGGKPLVLLVDNRSRPVADDRERKLSDSYTVRRMWAFVKDGSKWSFLQPCSRDFKSSEGRAPCRQAVALRDGKPEQVSVSAAYQETYMSRRDTAVPKFGGRTFAKQFETLSETKAPIAIITGWNEWIAQRFCFKDGKAASVGCTPDNDHFPDGSKVFVDAYDRDFNRDIEPAVQEEGGDRLYRLMADCIRGYRNGKPCQAP